jgi:tRNA(Ile2) C34 agmatinyltransferase TiaS
MVVVEISQEGWDVGQDRRTAGREEEENKELKEKLQLKQKMIFEEKIGFYGQENDEVPFCPRCWESDSKAIHLRGPNIHGNYKCPQCKTRYSTTQRDDPSLLETDSESIR